ncbi:MAG: minichromosome maintenance protein MCM [Candidatus Aenigmarchaeota archaeon]|nr:minichromosome maintenance protein MCM [Candidatus Aenigmarchaeota archaeon]
MDLKTVKDKFIDFFSEYYKAEIAKAISEEKSMINVDFSLLDRFDVELADYVLENPEEAIPLAEDALREISLACGPEEYNLKVRFFNLPESREIRIRNLRSKHIGKLLVVEGIVKRASEIRPEVSEAVFECISCGNKISVIQTERTIKAPKKCEVCGSSKGFRLVDQKLYDARWIVIEEPFEIVSGERPSDIMVYLKEDLTSPRMQNKTDPGNRIKIVGILKQTARRVRGTKSRQLEIYIEANNIIPLEVEWHDLEITPEDEQKIIELAKDPEIYKKLVQSIAPAIYGLEEIKESIALQLFGGVSKVLEDGTRLRGDIHILLIGDPSTAKSALMKVVAGLIPRGRYVSGKGVTAAGLTATVVRDEEFLGGWVLEAGALVLSNGSLCAIDEFEKVDKNDQVALHEAMEQQTISIAKASIVATLPARTSILAGGNPKLGRFDPYLPIKEQVQIPEPLLTRFDLKFALRDIPNPEFDEKIADHMIKTRYGRGEKINPPIPPDLFRKYVAYARKTCHPTMTEEAAKVLKEFYLALREKSGEDSPISITPRQYEALMRLAEASARIQLRDKVTKEDALRAIRLMSVSLRQFGFEPTTGKIDIDRAEGQKMTAAQRGKIRSMLVLLEELENAFGKEIPVNELIEKAKNQKIDNPDEILRRMLQEGLVYTPRPGFISRI